MVQQRTNRGLCNSDIPGAPFFRDADAEHKPASGIPVLLIGLLAVVSPLAVFGSTLILLHREWIHRLSGADPLLAALIYVVSGAAAAAAVTWVFWAQPRKNVRLNWSLAAASAAPGWALVTSAAFFLCLRSVWAEWISAMAGATLAFCLSKAIPTGAETKQPEPHRRDELFADVFWHEPWGWKPLALAVCIYAALFAVKGRSIPTASVLLAVSAFSLVWCYAGTKVAIRKGTRLSLAVRLVAATGVAVVLIAAALAPKVVEMSAGTPGEVAPHTRPAAKKHAQAASGPAWVAIELWPKLHKTHVNQIVLPETSVQSRKLSRPLVIRFKGPYWYFEGYQEGRGLQPHIAHGEPTSLNIYTNDGLPLVMEAHQKLRSPIRLVDCREIQVTIVDADRRPGQISLGVILTNSDAKGKPSIFLGSDPISSSPGDMPSLSASSSQELLAFQVPIRGRIDRFNEITVLFFPDARRSTLGPKIGIEQFEIFPR